MDRAGLFQKFRREKHQAISPVIATLLLILIAIAAGVIVYAYVIGFIGNSTSNPGGSTSLISIDNFCASASGKCNANGFTNQGYVVVIRNVGSNNIAIGTAQLYFTDITSGTTGSTTCSIAASVAPGSTYTCTSAGAAWPAGTIAPASGDNVQVKIVNPDSGTTTSTSKAIA